MWQTSITFLFTHTQRRLTLLMRQDTLTQMEGKEGRSTGKNTFLDVVYALHTDETIADGWRSGVHLICSSVIFLPLCPAL